MKQSQQDFLRNSFNERVYGTSFLANIQEGKLLLSKVI